MRAVKRSLAICLAVALLCGTLITANGAILGFSDATPIIADTPLTITLTKEASEELIAFVPERTGKYRLTAPDVEANYPYINLFTEDEVYLAQSDYEDEVYSILLEYDFIANETYFFYLYTPYTSFDEAYPATYVLTMTMLEAYPETMVHTLSFDANGGSYPYEPLKFIEGKPIVLKWLPTKTGAKFLGWALPAAPTTPLYNYHNTIQSGFGNDTTLVAVWDDSNVLMLDNALTLPFAANYAISFQFTPPSDGWYLISAVADDPDAAITLNSKTEMGNVSLYAQYTGGKTVQIPVKSSKHTSITLLVQSHTLQVYTVTFNANGGDWVPEPVVYSEGSSYFIPKEWATKEGDVFLGWSTDPNALWGESLYEPGSVKSGSHNVGNSSSYTLYAIWMNAIALELNKPSIVEYYHQQFFSFTAQEEGWYNFSFTAKDANTRLRLKKFGQFFYDSGKLYIFTVNPDSSLDHVNHWELFTALGTYTYAVKLAAGETLQYRLGITKDNYAITDEITALVTPYTPKTLALTYNANGGIGAPAAQSFQEVTGVTLSKAVPTHEGYAFTGWTEDPAGISYPRYQSGSVTSFGRAVGKGRDVSLYATWEPYTHLSLNVEDDRIYTNISSNYPQAYFTFTAEESGYYEIFRTKTVLERPMGDSGTPGSVSSETSVVKLEANESYSFSVRGAVNPGYVDRIVVVVKPFILKSYTVTYSAEGATGVPSPQECTESLRTYIAPQQSRIITFTIPNVTPTKQGHIFLGWDTSSLYRPGKEVTVAARNITLTARWAEFPPAQAIPLTLNTPLNTTAKNGEYWYSFTPESTQDYMLICDDRHPYFALFCDGSGNVVDDDCVSGFSKQTLTAGETYYYCAIYIGQSVTTDTTLEMVEVSGTDKTALKAALALAHPVYRAGQGNYTNDSWSSFISAYFSADAVNTNTTASPTVIHNALDALIKAQSELTLTSYALTVTNGSGTGAYAAGVTVTITAGAPPTGQQFKSWSVISGGVTLADANNASTTFSMPANAVTVTANFEAIPPAMHTLTLIPNGGTVNPTTVAQATGTTYSLPTPTHSGYTFNGWTLTNGSGSVSGSTYIFGEGNGTVTAQWTENPPAKNYIKLWGKTTKWEKTTWNWILCIALFGWIWMTFINP